LRWHSTTSEQPIIDFLSCQKRTEIKPQDQEPARENNQNIFIIIGVCCGLFIFLIIVVTLCKIKVKKFKRKAELKQNVRSENPTPNDGNNPENGNKSEDLCYEEVEDGQIVSARILQRKNHKIPIHKSETVQLQSNDIYLYTVPGREENSLNQTQGGINYENVH